MWIEWIRDHREFIFWGGVASILMFVGTLIIVPLMIVRMGEDYFMPDRQSSFAKLHPALRLIGLILKNLLGVIFLLMGIVMIFVPGQGLLTILLGLAMLNLPGKRAAELKLVAYPPVRQSINWIRAKANQPPLKIPAQD